MTLSDLIDLETQLAHDRDADPATLEARDRRLVRGFAHPPERGREERRASVSTPRRSGRWLRLFR